LTESQGRNLVVTVSCVPSLLDSGLISFLGEIVEMSSGMPHSIGWRSFRPDIPARWRLESIEMEKRFMIVWNDRFCEVACR
jgi:hypothetical protein